MRNLVAAVLLAATLSACSTSPTGPTTVSAVEVGGVVHRCLKSDDMQIPTGSTLDLKGDIRRRLLTPAALNAGVRVFISDSTVNAYGQVVLLYSNAENTCLLWSESIPSQEYAQRIGLNPITISPYFTADVAKPVTPPATTPPVTPSK